MPQRGRCVPDPDGIPPPQVKHQFMKLPGTATGVMRSYIPRMSPSLANFSKNYQLVYEIYIGRTQIGSSC